MALRTIQTLAIGAGGCGLEMGLHLSGIDTRTICYVEREAFAAANLVKKMQEGKLDDAPIWGDARTFDGRPWRGRVDLITSGYPCQPFSAAGKGLGTDDPRHLWPTIERIITECEPGACFFENSPRHVGIGLDEVWGGLRDLGFWVEAGTFSAQETGADHIRERLFILAANPDRCSLRIEPERGTGQTREAFAGHTEPGHDGEARANPDSNGDRRQGLAASRVHAQGQRRNDPDGLRPRYDGLKGEPWGIGIVPKPSIQRVVTRMAGELDMCVRTLRNHRLFVIGNGVVPSTAALAFNILGRRLGLDTQPQVQ